MNSVLIVDDEDRWHMSMQRNLEDTTSNSLNNNVISIAEDLSATLLLLRSRPWQLLSLDMRIPDRPGSLVKVDIGEKLSKEIAFKLSVSKKVVYSATLNVELADFRNTDAMLVSSLKVDDKYGKAAESVPPVDANQVQVLNAQGWALRVMEYLRTETRELNPKPGEPKRLSVLGAWLEGAPHRLPPMLARLAQGLSNVWEDKSTAKIDAALQLIEAAGVLALVQTAVLIDNAAPARHKGLHASLQINDRQSTVLTALEALMQQHAAELSHWNWSGWLDADMLQTLRLANTLRNDVRHSFQTLNARETWARLLPLLRHVMDLCGYWALHPLYTDLQYSRNGWRGQMLASTAWPTAADALPVDADFPDDAATHGRAVGDPYWQGVYQRASANEPWQYRAVQWSDWLLRDDPEPGAWLLQWRRPQPSAKSTMRVNLLDGRRLACPR